MQLSDATNVKHIANGSLIGAHYHYAHNCNYIWFAINGILAYCIHSVYYMWMHAVINIENGSMLHFLAFLIDFEQNCFWQFDQ